MDRIPIEGATCPRCGDRLATIDWDASDDERTRQFFGHVAWWRRFVLYPYAFAVIATLAFAVWLMREGNGTLRDWGLLARGAGLLMAVAVALIVPLVRVIRQARRSPEGRLAACHGCGHRWRL